MSEPKNEIEDLPQAELELTPEQAEGVAGGAMADYLLKIDNIKGDSNARGSTGNTYRGTTTINEGTLN